MDHIDYQNKQALARLKNFQILKMMTQLLFSVSVFSFLFAQSSWLSSPHSFKFHFSKLPFNVFTHTIDKNYIFLFCNGLLVFLTKYSGLLRSMSSYNRNHDILKIYEDGSMSDSMIDAKAPILKDEVIIQRYGSAADGEVEKGNDNENWGGKVETEGPELMVERDEEEIENKFMILEEEEHEEVAEESRMCMAENKEEEGNEMLSTEELNRKFDEFIRRMKEEIRTEAQQQLVMVQ